MRSCCCKCGDKNKSAEKSVKIVILLGAPGAGKGTVAQYLLDKYGIVHFSTGNLLRNEVKNDTEIGREVGSILGSGGLVGDDIVNRVIESNLLKTLSDGCVVLLDGYPRTVEQAKFLDSIDDEMLKSKIRVVEIDVDHEVVVSRISSRLVCSKCGGTFSSSNVPASSPCEQCGGELVKRADDEESVVRRRLQEYVNATLPVSAYYVDRLSKVSGDASPECVARSVDDVFRSFDILDKEIS
jgi:adenylate kinase